MTAAVLEDGSRSVRVATQRLVTQLPYEAIPEMIAPSYTVSTRPPPGYTRDMEMRTDAPFFNASAYCNRLNVRFSLWLRHPATIALIHAFGAYYREAAHELRPDFIMQVKTGARCVHGYYVHVSLHDALSAWCDFMLIPPAEAPRMPLGNAGTATTQSYGPATSGSSLNAVVPSSLQSTGQSSAIQPGTTTMVYTLRSTLHRHSVDSDQLASQIANAIAASRGGTA